MSDERDKNNQRRIYQLVQLKKAFPTQETYKREMEYPRNRLPLKRCHNRKFGQITKRQIALLNPA